MRKYLSLFIIVLMLVMLVACDKDEKLDDFTITHQELIGNIYEFTVNTTEDVQSNDDLLEIGHTASGQIYDVLNTSIGLKKFTLKLTITVANEEKLLLIFIINNSITEPGLKLLETNFK